MIAVPRSSGGPSARAGNVQQKSKREAASREAKFMPEVTPRDCVYSSEKRFTLR